MSNLPKIIALMGQTASGKSKMALKLAKEFNGEIISADSRNIYKNLNIATDKPEFKKTKQGYFYQGIPHYLVNIVNPDQKFSVAQFKPLAVFKIKEIIQKNKLPILAGGTGLYIKAVLENYSFPGVAPDNKLRNELEKKAKNKGLETLWQELIKIDPGSKNIVDKNNPRRVIRALEVCFKKDKAFSKIKSKKPIQFNSLKIGIKLSEKKLFQKQSKRVDKMIEKGLIKETKNLINKYGKTQVLLNTIGYQEIIPYLEGKISLKKAIKEIKLHTRQFSKRQETWFKKEKNIKWVKNFQEAKNITKNFLN
ncbi:MAG TPA: tRNA (adenosine(37)-N6)-dimethylallyltransferase MiaA [Patescibacteria group bacterium]|nr:tRNA (adenosine(37)-N6)-dimethylallyltransferase MiaA [Patescibacteria group bacterium]